MSAPGKGSRSKTRRRGLSAEDRALWDRVASTAKPLAASASNVAQASAAGAPPDAAAGRGSVDAPKPGEASAFRRPDAGPTFARQAPDAGPTLARQPPDANPTSARRKPDGFSVRPVGKPSGPVITTRAAASPLDSLTPGAGLDKRTAGRLKRGKRNPEARLDLHGMTAATAHSTLARFLHRARSEGKRCVLVITGKGGRKPAEDAPYMPERIGVLRYAVPEWLTTPPLAPLVVGVYPAHQSHGGSGALYVYLKKPR